MKQEIIVDEDGTPMINLDSKSTKEAIIPIVEILKVEKIVDWLNGIFGFKFEEEEK